MASKYWEDRIAEEIASMYDIRLAKLERELARQELRMQKKLMMIIKDVYQEIIDYADGGALLVSDLYRYSNYYEMLGQLNKILQDNALMEQELMEKHLIDMYMKCSKYTVAKFGLRSIFDEKSAYKAVQAIWCADGKSWSSRIWNNKELLKQDLLKGLTDCVAMGASKDRLVTTLMKDFNQSFHNADRLARTELAHIQNQASFDRYDEAGVTQWEWYTCEDERVCPICNEKNGKIFDMNNTKDLPPQGSHANCRCCILPVIDTVKQITYPAIKA